MFQFLNITIGGKVKEIISALALLRVSAVFICFTLQNCLLSLWNFDGLVRFRRRISTFLILIMAMPFLKKVTLRAESKFNSLFNFFMI